MNSPLKDMLIGSALAWMILVLPMQSCQWMGKIDHSSAVQARIAAALEKIADGLQRSTEARQTQPERAP